MACLALSGSYSRAEKIGLAVGSIQVVFFVIMPWMLAYQQSACALERNSVDELQNHRFETKIGSFITQGVMSAVLIMAAAVGATNINNVEDLAAISRTICRNAALGNAITLAAVIGACIVAAIVVMLCAAWVIEEMVRVESSAPLDGPTEIRPGSEATAIERVRARPAYYCGILITIAAAVIVVVIGGNDNTGFLDVYTQILNGLLMIPIVFVLWYLTSFCLPECPLTGARRCVTGATFLVCCVFSVVGLTTTG